MEKSRKFKINVRCSDVIDECERQFGYERKALRAKTKDPTVTKGRHTAVYLCRIITGRSYPQIAIAIGYKDHTTCMYACKLAPIAMKDKEWAAKAKAVMEAFYA